MRLIHTHEATFNHILTLLKCFVLPVMMLMEDLKAYMLLFCISDFVGLL